MGVTPCEQYRFNKHQYHVRKARFSLSPSIFFFRIIIMFPLPNPAKILYLSRTDFTLRDNFTDKRGASGVFGWIRFPFLKKLESSH